MKKVVILTLSTLLLVGLITGCGCKKKEKETKKDEVKVNTTRKVPSKGQQTAILSHSENRI